MDRAAGPFLALAALPRGGAVRPAIPGGRPVLALVMRARKRNGHLSAGHRGSVRLTLHAGLLLGASAFLALALVAEGDAGLTADLEPEYANRTVKTGSFVNYSLTISNTGGISASYDLTNGTAPAGWSLAKNASPITVPAGGSASIFVNITPPTGATGGENWNATITATNTVNGADADNVSLNTSVALYDVSMVATAGATRTSDPEQTTTYNLDVTNTGNGWDAFQMSSSTPPTGWSVSLSPSYFGLDPGKNRSVTMTVAIEAFAGNATYLIDARATSQGNTSRVATVTTSTTVRRVHGVELSVNRTSATGLPGENVTYLLTIRNTGNDYDTFNFTNSTPPSGWTAVDNTSSIPNLWKNSSAAVTLGIRSPGTATAGQQASVTATATSQGNASKTASATTTTTVIQPELIITDTTWYPSSPATGDNVTFNALIRNTGTAAAGTFRVRFEMDSAGTAGFLDAPERVINGLATGITIAVTSGNWSANNSGITHTIRAIADSSSQVAESNETNNTRDESFTISSAPPPSSPDLVVLDIAWSPASPAAGETVAFNATIKNQGSATANSSWANFTLGNTTFIGNVSVSSIATGAQTTVTASGWTAVAGQHWIAVRADAGGAVNETDESNNAFQETVSVASGPDYNVSLTANTTARTGSPGENVTFTLTLTNTGTQSDTFTISRSTLPGWTTGVSPAPATLGAGQAGTLTAWMVVPSNASDGDVATLTVTATSQGNASRNASVALTTTVSNAVPVYDVALSISPASKVGGPGTSVNFQLTATNRGNQPDTVDLTVQAVAGWQLSAAPTPATLAAGESASATLTVQIPAGAQDGQSVEARVTATSRGNSSKAANVSGQVTVQTGQPQISLTISPSTVVIEPGAKARFMVTLTNHWTRIDNVTLSVTLNASWKATLNATNVSVQGGASADVSLEVAPPPGSENGSEVVTVRARSGAGAPDASTTASVEVRSQAAFGLDATPIGQEVPENGTANYTLTIRNTGRAAGRALLGIADPDPRWRERLSEEQVFVPPGGEAQVILSVTAPGSGSRTTFVTVEDVDGASRDATSVTTRVQARGPDLVADVSSVLFDPPTPRVRQPYRLFVLVHNAGDLPASASVLEVYEGSPEAGSRLGTAAIPRLLAGGRHQARVEVPDAGLAGPRLLTLIVDAERSVAESDEDNNVAVVPAVVALPSTPDPSIRAEDISVSKQNPQPGDTVTVFALVRNLGGSAVSVTASFSSDGATFGQVRLSLDASGSAMASARSSSGATAFTVTLGSEDPEDANPNNNEATLPARVEPPDLVLSVASGPVQVRLGEAAILEVQIACVRALAGVRPQVLEASGLTVEFDEGPSDCAAGDVVTFTARVTAQGAGPRRLYIRAASASGAGNAAVLTMSVAPAEDLGGPLLLGAVGVAAVASLGAVWGNENWRYRSLLLLLPLYHRLEKSQVLNHDLRWRIYEQIQATPGVNYGTLKRSLQLRNGTLTHHLVMLERQELIAAQRDGLRKRFYLSGHRMEPPSPLSGVQRSILEIVSGAPGATQKEIGELLGLSKQVVNYHIRAMERAGFLRLERAGRFVKCYPVQRQS